MCSTKIYKWLSSFVRKLPLNIGEECQIHVILSLALLDAAQSFASRPNAKSFVWAFNMNDYSFSDALTGREGGDDSTRNLKL